MKFLLLNFLLLRKDNGGEVGYILQKHVTIQVCNYENYGILRFEIGSTTTSGV